MFEIFCRRVDISKADIDVELVKELEGHERSVTELESKKDNIEQAFDWEIITKNLVTTDLLVKL